MCFGVPLILCCRLLELKKIGWFLRNKSLVVYNVIGCKVALYEKKYWANLVGKLKLACACEEHNSMLAHCWP